jgi:hypothetical protein
MLLHISPAVLSLGTLLTPGERGFVCLATSTLQAVWWGTNLHFKRSAADSNVENLLSIYTVHVFGDGLVENCRGHYAFEYKGVVQHASTITTHDDYDGEVVSRNPVAVQHRRFLTERDKYFLRYFASDDYFYRQLDR